MDGGKLIILDPVSLPNTKRHGLNPRPKNMKGLRIATVDNTKPNFNIFLDRVQELMLSDYGVAEVRRFRKPGRTVPVAPEIVAEIKANYDFAITGLGD